MSAPGGTGELDAEQGLVLRLEIQRLIRESNLNPAKAALAICVMLDEELDLAEDGWFDNDKVTQNAILAGDSEDD